MKKILLGLLVLFLVVVTVVLFNTFTSTKTSDHVKLAEITAIPEGAIDRFTEAISIRTVSFENEADFDSTQFQMFNEFMRDNYPLLHKEANHSVFNSYSHLFEIKGSDSTLEPYLIITHQDVVPIASPALWTVHPFTEGVKNDTIYGRGCIDDKGSVVSVLEAIEQLLGEGFTPKRTLYISVGHDEEIGGNRGAVEIAKYLEEKNIRLSFILDEGGAITQGLIPGMDQKTAVIGVAEKGTVTFELEVMMSGGHSSKPEAETSIDVLATAVSNLKRNPFPKKMSPVLKGFMDEVGPHMGFVNRMAMSNRWLFGSMILGQYEKSTQGNASIRTTTAPTIFEAGVKDNVVPTLARAVVNFRIVPGETVESTRERMVQVINDERVTVTKKGKGMNPSKMSPIDGPEYALISNAIKSIFPDLITCPNLMIGATDSRHFTHLTSKIYRFTPWRLTPENINCFHGIDERVGVHEYENAIRFYRQVIILGGNL